MTRSLTEEQRRAAIEVIAKLPHEELAELVLAFAEGRSGWDLRRTKRRFLSRVREEIRKAEAEADALRQDIEREEAWIRGYEAALDTMTQDSEGSLAEPKTGDTV